MLIFEIGPHALACAARLPGCIAALCIAGCAPYDAEGLDWIAGQGEDSKLSLEDKYCNSLYCYLTLYSQTLRNSRPH